MAWRIRGLMAVGEIPGHEEEKGRLVRSCGAFFGFRARKLENRITRSSSSRREVSESVRAVEKGR